MLTTIRAFSVAAILLAAGSAPATDTTLYGSEPPLPDSREWRSAVFQVDSPGKMDAREAARLANEGRFAPDIVITPPEQATQNPYVWKIVFLLYPSINAPQTVSGVTTQFTHTLSPAEIQTALNAMDGATTGILTGSNGEARPMVTKVIVGRTLTSLAVFGADVHWPDASITAPELIAYGQGKADSAIVYWPAWNHSNGTHINNPYWGLSYGRPQGWTYDVGYSTVSNIVSPLHSTYYPGEVMLHEWMHPVSDYYDVVKNCDIPNLDGATNYRPCPACANYALVTGDGWMPFYRDFMRGTVWDSSTSRYLGIPPAAWRSGTPTNSVSRATGWQLYE